MDLSGITPTGVASGGLPVTSRGSTHCVLSHLELLHSLSGDLPVTYTHPSPSHLWSHVVGRLPVIRTMFSLIPILNWPGNETDANTMAHGLMRLNIEQLGTGMGQPWSLITAVL